MEKRTVGVQVMALGITNFKPCCFTGGLPGFGWAPDAKKEPASGKTDDDKTELTGKEWKGTMKRTASRSASPSDEKLGELKKVVRKSPTLGAKAPEGAVVLFDGTKADAWNDGKIVHGKLLDIGPTSKQSFKDFTLHVEFRCPFMPLARGQARGNSGVYLQNRYEIQVLDSLGAVGDHGDCGAVSSDDHGNGQHELPAAFVADIRHRSNRGTMRRRWQESGRRANYSSPQRRDRTRIISTWFAKPLAASTTRKPIQAKRSSVARFICKTTVAIM